MGKLRKETLKFLISFITGIVCGTLIGAAILAVIVSYRLDNQYKRITYLETTIEDKDARLKKLEESINTQGLILQDIEVNLNFNQIEEEDNTEENDKGPLKNSSEYEIDNIDDIDKIDIEKNIKQKYNSLLGKEIKNIDPDIIVEVIDKRIFKLENREYRLKVEKLILTETLRLYINVELRE